MPWSIESDMAAAVGRNQAVDGREVQDEGKRAEDAVEA